MKHTAFETCRGFVCCSLRRAPECCCPLPLSGAYDYKLPKGTNAARGLLVSAPLGPRQQLGVVWGAAEGSVGDNRLKEAVPLEGFSRHS